MEKILSDRIFSTPISTGIKLSPHHVEVQYGKLAFGGAPQIVLFANQDQDGDKKWTAAGSGFAVLHEGLISIVTAGHVAAELKGKPLVLIGPHGSVLVSPNQCRLLFNEEIDLALMTIPSVDLAELFGICVCIELDDHVMDAADSDVSALYQVYGYPLAKNKYSKTSGWKINAFRVSLGRQQPVPARSKLLDLKLPLLAFHIDLENMMDDQLMKDNRLGALKGMSGGPVLRHTVGAEHGAGKIVGIFLEWHATERTAVALPAAAIKAALQIWGHRNAA
jgi:hypothetical protein